MTATLTVAEIGGLLAEARGRVVELRDLVAEREAEVAAAVAALDFDGEEMARAQVTLAGLRLELECWEARVAFLSGRASAALAGVGLAALSG